MGYSHGGAAGVFVDDENVDKAKVRDVLGEYEADLARVRAYPDIETGLAETSDTDIFYVDDGDLRLYRNNAGAAEYLGDGTFIAGDTTNVGVFDHKVRLNLSALGLDTTKFPSGQWYDPSKVVVLPGVSASLPAITGSANPALDRAAVNFNVWEIRYQVIAGVAAQPRWKRMYVAAPTFGASRKMRPEMVVALHATSGANRDGATQLWNPYAPEDVEHQWPLHVAADLSCWAVMIDQTTGNKDGADWVYPATGWGDDGYAVNAYDPLIDHICGIEIAKWFIMTANVNRELESTWGAQPIKPKVYLGGLSWGAHAASFLAGALRDVSGVYLSGMYIARDRYTDVSPGYDNFNPVEWRVSGEDYVDMYLRSKLDRMVIEWGAADHAYLGVVGEPNSATYQAWSDDAFTTLNTANATKFPEKKISTSPEPEGHEINLDHCRETFMGWRDAMSGGMAHLMPEMPS